VHSPCKILSLDSSNFGTDVASRTIFFFFVAFSKSDLTSILKIHGRVTWPLNKGSLKGIFKRCSGRCSFLFVFFFFFFFVLLIYTNNLLIMCFEQKKNIEYFQYGVTTRGLTLGCSVKISYEFYAELSLVEM
jgi:hypothetical protein